MTPEQHIARIREKASWLTTVSVEPGHFDSSALSLCDAYEALAEAARAVLTPCEVRELAGPRRGWCMAHNEYLRSDGCPMAVLASWLGKS